MSAGAITYVEVQLATDGSHEVAPSSIARSQEAGHGVGIGGPSREHIAVRTHHERIRQRLGEPDDLRILDL